MKLYEIKEQFLTLDKFIEENEESKDSFKMAFEQIQGSLEEKAEGYIKYMKNLTAEAEAFKTEADRMSKKASSLKAHADRVKSTLDETLQELNIKELNAGLFKIRYQNNPKSVTILDLEAIPMNYKMPVEPKIDKRAILQDIENGIEVAGVEVTQTLGMRIK